jgi:hypothetical protein
MKIAIKAILLQLIWFAITWLGPMGYWYLLIPASYLLVVIDFKIYLPKISFFNYLSLATGFAFIGLVVDYLLYHFQLISFKSGSFEIWQLSMWIIFVPYYDQIFKSFTKSKIIAFIFGAFGGPMAYIGVQQMGGLVINNNLITLTILGIFWGVFLILSLKLYQTLSKAC